LHHAVNTPANDGAPWDWVKYAPSIPQFNPKMKTVATITTVEETIRMPDWRNASPKKRNTPSPNTCRMTPVKKRPISPVAAIHSRGIASRSFI
jgi:hypothetical protein